MRQRSLVLLVMLLVSLGTIVVASGILLQDTPGGIDGDGTRGAAASPPARQKAISYRHLKHGGVTFAPPADQQDPVRDPHAEPPFTPAPEPAGGAAGIDPPHAGSGDFLVHKGSQAAPRGKATYTVRIEVEEGLPISVEEFSEFVMETLNHEQSWAKDGATTFARTDAEGAIRIMLASPATTDALCVPLPTNSMWSCGREGRAVINADRWLNGAEAFVAAGGEIVEYRRYLINHEMGHLLGHEHVSCPRAGEPAPVMVQQSISLQGCAPNGWVHP